MDLRGYQKDAIHYLHDAWDSGIVRVPIVLATGLGKTVIFSNPALINRFLDAGKRVLVLAHTDELCEQAAKHFRRANPGRRVGIVKAERNEVTAQIIVSSRQTLGHATGGPRRLASIRNVGLIIIDEAHHALRTNTYGKILDHFGAFCFTEDDRATWKPGCHADHPLVAGFTATLARGDREKLSTVWQEPPGGIFTKGILFGIRHGFLLDVAGKRVVVPDFDMGNVRKVGGDYQDSSIAEELERTFAPEIIAREYAEHAGARKGIAFWPLVDTAYHGAKAFNEQGIRSEVIHGELPKPERRALLARLHSGETQVVHGVGVLTEGFDEPTVDVVIVARPTRSAPLYQQMVGRVLRPDLTKAPEERGKALVLDVVGAGAQHDLRSLIDLAPERPLRAEDPNLSLLELDDDLLLIEAENSGQGGAGFELEDASYVGETEVVEFDPLGRSSLWQRTPGGTWFVPAGSVGYAFLVESLAGEPSHYDVALCSKLSYPHDGVTPWVRGTEYVDLALDEALGWAEELAVEVGGHGTKSLIGRKSKWRNDEPSPAQKAWCTRNGIDWTGKTKGEVAEIRNGMDAARRLDPLVAAVKQAAQGESEGART